MKRFIASGVFLPVDWARAIGLPSHRRQGSVLVTATSRKHAVEVLAARGLYADQANHLAADLRLDRAPVLPAGVRLMSEAAVIDLDAPGVHLWAQNRAGEVIVRAEDTPAGTLTVVGRFTHDDTATGRGLYVEPVTEEES
ncbi:hypothetical protein AB0395_22210 [Streptosporangium sp. NPDC051023]|uniref:hypothetical protein n=1 Tax=Streptosporangium sp. NPDC051023 TaxID=3155410 RepID=UPI00344DE079